MTLRSERVNTASPPQPSSVQALLAAAIPRLREAGVDEPSLEAHLLLGHASGLSRTTLFAFPERRLDPEVVDAFEVLIARRVSRVPLAHLTGRREFYGHELHVGPRVLVPRPESEMLVEAALEALRCHPPTARPRVLDLGTGSGSMAISIALDVGAARARVFASDLSADALRLAAANAARLGARVHFFQGDLLAAVQAPIDVLVANLPYVSRSEVAEAEPEVRDHEPGLALLGGERGTELIEAALPAIGQALAPEGVALLEIGWRQGIVLRHAARVSLPGFSVSVRPDAAGLDRMLRIARV